LYNESKITASPSWKENNGPNMTIYKPDGLLFDGSANPKRIFSRGSSGNNPGSDGELLQKEDEINECGREGLNRCNSSSNCDFVNYSRSSDNTYSYCVLREFREGINPDTDAVYESSDRIRTWIKSDNILSSS
tara:strand:- start:760 stop:1158 length:399 start_codon:yes stop_codon:yes gene_type:complete